MDCDGRGEQSLFEPAKSRIAFAAQRNERSACQKADFLVRKTEAWRVLYSFSEEKNSVILLRKVYKVIVSVYNKNQEITWEKLDK